VAGVCHCSVFAIREFDSLAGLGEHRRVPTNVEKRELYAQAATRIGALIAGEPDRVARMAGIVAVLHGTMPHYYWTGFYRVVGGRLVIGPYQGTPGCGRIGWGRGVCGIAWATGETQVVLDVHAFPGHIACDARSASEIVVPVRDRTGRVVAVFDVDSLDREAFTEEDQVGLEAIFAAWGE
jgi:L-methionine (R)-S-oxide reductase